MPISHTKSFDTPYWITILEDFKDHFNELIFADSASILLTKS